MKLVLLGLPRTGTMSTWGFFKNHPEVSISIPKEYLTIHYKDLSNYVNRAHFINKKKINVILDGSPGLFLKYEEFGKTLYEIRSQHISDIVMIYNIRDPIKQLISMIDRKVWGYLKGVLPIPEFVDSTLDVKEDELIELSKFMLNDYNYLTWIEGELGKKNIYFIKLEEFESKQKDIFKFLGISTDTTYKFPVSNTCWELGYSIKQLKAKNEVIKFVDKHMDELKPVMEESQRKRKERYGI